jgi:hypothetical protein
MQEMNIPDKELFGPVSDCKNINEIIQFINSSYKSKETAIAFGMLQAACSVQEGPYRENILDILNSLNLAKMTFDKSFCHTHPVIDITQSILFAAQNYADEMTIPCTEWPTQAEVIAVVCSAAKKWIKK